MKTLLTIALCFLSLVIDCVPTRAEAPPGLVPLVRFYNTRTNEHCYTASETEVAAWRKATDLKEHYAIGLAASKRLSGTIPLYRHVRNRDARQIYTTVASGINRSQRTDPSFQVYVWATPGDGRIPIYCSTWLDHGDVFFEPGLENVLKFSADSKQALGVDRLRPVEGALFYLYPNPAAQAASAAPAATTPQAKTASQPTTDASSEAKPSTGSSNRGSADTSMRERPLPLEGKERTGPAEEQSVDFRQLDLANPVTSFDITEDGKFLLLTHQAADLVSVYEILTGKVIATISCQSPRSVISRGGLAFVANYGHGTISVLARSNRWKLVDQLLVEKPNIVHIAAARRDHFAGELVVTCHAGGKPSYEDGHIYLVDTRKDRCRAIAKIALASVSADGRLLVTQETFNGSPSGTIAAYNYKDFTAENAKREAIYRGGVGQTPYIYQVVPGSYWLTDKVILGGVPIQLLRPDTDGSLIVPDYSQSLFYTLSQDVVRAHRLSTTFPELEMRRVKYPALVDEFRKVNQHVYRMRGYTLDHPIAITHGQRLYLFLLTTEGGAVLTAETQAFQTPTEDLAASRPEQLDRHGLKEPPPGEPPRKQSPPDQASRSQSAAKEAVSAWSDGLTDQIMNGFPRMIPAGEEFRHRWQLASSATFELVTEIDGLTLTPQGELRWRVTEDHIGKHEVKLRLKHGDEIAIERVPLEVVDARLFAASDGDPATLDRLYRLDLEIDSYVIAPAANGSKLLLLQGETLKLVAANGYEVERTFSLPKRYKFLQDRRQHLVAVSLEDGHTVDIIDKASMKVRRSIRLEKAGARISEVTDLAIDPTRNVCYVAVKLVDQMPEYSILTVDENSGRVGTPDIFGTWVQVSPDGRRLYTGYRDLYQRGSSFHISPSWQLIEIPEYGNVDMLLSWDTRGKGELKQAVTKAGTNGHGIRMSPDGKRVVYLSFRGDPNLDGDLLGWNGLNFKEPAVRYPTRDRGATTELAFHPWLPWLAVPGGTSAVFFHQETGELLENKLVITSSGLGEDKVERLYFSPDGKHLLFVCSGSSGRYLRAVGLRLSTREAATKRREPVVPKAEAKPVVVPVAELHGLYPPPEPPSELSPKEIGKRYLDAVVSIVTDRGSGSGFFIGKSGYLLTSAHVVEDAEKINVIHNRDVGQQFVAMESTGRVIRADPALDVALLKVSCSRELPYVILAREPTVDTGESVIVIGSPGLGEAILNRTMTSGIVSNPDRLIDDQHYIQTSAAINAGNSGGAMFDSRGQVIGLINLKAQIDGAGFATPARALREFLREATRK